MERGLRGLVATAAAALASVALVSDKRHIWVVAPTILYSGINIHLTPLVSSASLALVLANAAVQHYAAPSTFGLIYPLLAVYL